MAENETHKPDELKSDKELLNKWRTRVTRAKRLREWWEREFQVELCEKFFLGKQLRTTDQSHVVNYFFATVKAVQPNLFFTNPRFLVRPQPGKERSVKHDLQAAVGEGLLTSIAKQDFNLERAARMGLQQAFFRIGVLKVVYAPQLSPNPDAGQSITDELGRPIAIEPDLIVDDDVYRFEWVNAKNMLLPDQGPDPIRWTWLGEEVVVSMEEARNDQRFPQHLRDKLKPNEKEQQRLRGGSGGTGHERFEDDTDGLVRYFEVYDLINKNHFIWVDDQDFDDEFLVKEPTPEGIEDHPYAILLGWTPILAPDPIPWPFPHTLPWLDLQNEYNIRRQQITEGSKRSGRKIYYDESTFANPDEAIKAMKSSRDMEGVQLTSTDRPPVTLPDPDLPVGIYNDIPMLINDWRVVTGQTGARLTDVERTTATESNFVERAASLRDVDMQQAVGMWLATAGKKMLQLVSQTMTLSRWITIRGMDDSELKRFAQEIYGIKPEVMDLFPGVMEIIKARFGETKPLEVNRETLEFEASVDVTPGSQRPRTLAEERKDWLELLQIFGQFPQLAMSRELLAETASKYEFINERMVDELQALAKQMIEINANQAGRNQGEDSGEGSLEQRIGALTQ